MTFEDRRFDYAEQRFITLGMLRTEVVVIATAGTDEAPITQTDNRPQTQRPE